MGFNPVNDDDSISRPRRFAEKDLHLIGSGADDARFHRRLERDPQSGFADPVFCQQLDLALRCRSAMTAHGRNHKGFRAGCLEKLHHRGDDGLQIRDAAAADAHGNAGACLQPRRKHG